MNNKKLLTLSLIMAMTATQAAAKNIGYDVESAANIAIPQVDSSKREAATYIWPQVHQSAEGYYIEKRSHASNEYWQVVTGAELVQGMQVHATSDALIRLASYASYESGAKQVSRSIDPNMLTLSTTSNKSVQARQIVSQNQMQQAGFPSGSVALMLPDNSDNLMLKTNQRLGLHDRYLLHVKEKNSPLLLNMTAKSNVAGLADNSMNIDVSLAGQQINSDEIQVRLLDPKGKEVDVEFKNSQVTFTDDLTFFGSHQGLYELEVNILKMIDGKQVKRTLKFPFANTVKTAEIKSQPVLDMESGYQLPISVSEPGRYSVTATLQGENANGELVRLQTAESANWLDADNVLSLPFTLNEFSQYKNFSLVDVKLMDQSRMMLQQVVASTDSL